MKSGNKNKFGNQRKSGNKNSINIFNFTSRKNNRRGAIALSVNFLVIIIISLVVLGMGITLLYKFVNAANEKKTEITQRQQEELQRLLVDEGQRVALPLHIADLYGGESHVFGIGILNVDPTNDQFKLMISLDTAVDTAGDDMTSKVKDDAEKWVLYFNEYLVIKENEHHNEGILLELPGSAPKGKYIYNAKVIKADDLQYGNTQKFIVNVN